jgi:hypothetical protein
MTSPGPNLSVDIELIVVEPDVAVIDPPPPPPLAEIVTEPFDAEVIVTLFPAIR